MDRDATNKTTNSRSSIDAVSKTTGISNGSFIRFIFYKKSNRVYLAVAVAGMIFQLFLFKSFYPFADFFSDSYSYIYAAYAHLDVNVWPIGYSKFLSFFHWLTHSDTALVAFQYIFLQLSALVFFFTVLLFYNPGKVTSIILFIFLFFNPLSLYISNYVNSDPIFAALSLLWFAQLLWIIFRPSISQIFIQGVLLFLVFTVRNNAYYYPVIAIIAFALSKQRTIIKISGAFLGLILIVPFIVHTRNEAFKITGARQFSLFTGWQLANNALYMYDKVQVDSNQLPNAACRELNRMAMNFYKQVPPDFDEYLSGYVGNYFIRQPDAPLKQYLMAHYNITDEYGAVLAWGRSSVVFSAYGDYLIKKNPWAYIKYFMAMNAVNYFLPPLEKLKVYNVGNDEVYPIAQYWFHYKSLKVTSVSRRVQGQVLYIFPWIFMAVNIYMLVMYALYFVQKKFRHASIEFNRSILLTGSLLAANFFFCVFATIIVFRYEFFPLLVLFSYSLFMMELFDKREIQSKGSHSDLKEKNQKLEFAQM